MRALLWSACAICLLLCAYCRSLSQPSTVDVIPAHRQDLGDREPGSRIDVEYTVTNRSPSPLCLTLISKSCPCIKASIEKNALVAGESCLITLSVTVSDFGVDRGGVVLGASGDFVDYITLDYEVRARIGAEMAIAPAEVELTSAEWPQGWIGKVAVRCPIALTQMGAPPPLPQIQQGKSIQIAPWKMVSNVGWICELMIETGPIEPADSLSLRVQIGDVASRQLLLTRGR